MNDDEDFKRDLFRLPSHFCIMCSGQHCGPRIDLCAGCHAALCVYTQRQRIAFDRLPVRVQHEIAADVASGRRG